MIKNRDIASSQPMTFKVTDKVRLKRAINNGEVQIPQGSVGDIAEIYSADRPEDVTLLVNFHKKKMWDLVKPEDLMLASKTKSKIPPKLPDDV